MKTKGEALKNKIENSLNEINRLLGVSYIEENYSKLFKTLGGEIEKFLKSTIFLNQKNNLKFNALINSLSTFNISQSSIQFLHDFRKIYNGYKHNSTFSIDLIDAKTAFENVNNAIEEINSKKLGVTTSTYIEKSKRIVWVAGWDDYVGGMVEVGIFIPDYSIDYPLGIETFNISFEGWDFITKKFITSGELKFGKDSVSKIAFDNWNKENDFVNAGSFNGDISELVQELAKYVSSYEKQLLSFLQRENDSSSVKCSLIFSLFDTLRENSWNNIEDFFDEINLRASFDYGININSSLLNLYLNKIDKEAITRLRNRLKSCDDILWVDLDDYNKLKNEVLSEDLFISIDGENRIIIRIR